MGLIISAIGALTACSIYDAIQDLGVDGAIQALKDGLKSAEESASETSRRRQLEQAERKRDSDNIDEILGTLLEKTTVAQRQEIADKLRSLPMK